MIKTYCDKCGNLIDRSFSDSNAINVDGRIYIRKYITPMSSKAHTTHYVTSSEIVNKHYDLCTSCFTVFVNNFMSNVKGEEK